MRGNPLKQFYAFIFGYFWLPCPFPGCGRWFGGFEFGEYGIPDPDRPGIHQGTCKRHNHLEVERRNALISRLRKDMGIN